MIAANLREVRRVLRGDGIGYLHFPVEDRAVFHIPFARHGYERLRHLKHSVLRHDPSMTDETFRGVPPLSTNGVRTLCADASLDVVEVVADETNPPGTCVFFRVRPAA